MALHHPFYRKISTEFQALQGRRLRETIALFARGTRMEPIWNQNGTNLEPEWNRSIE